MGDYLYALLTKNSHLSYSLPTVFAGYYITYCIHQRLELVRKAVEITKGQDQPQIRSVDQDTEDGKSSVYMRSNVIGIHSNCPSRQT